MELVGLVEKEYGVDEDEMHSVKGDLAHEAHKLLIVFLY